MVFVTENHNKLSKKENWKAKQKAKPVVLKSLHYILPIMIIKFPFLKSDTDFAVEKTNIVRVPYKTVLLI